MKVPYIVFRLLSLTITGLILYFAYRLLFRTWVYTNFDTNDGFLVAKQTVLDSTGYLASFYVHVFTSWPILVLGLLQFSRRLYQRWPNVHRWLGRLYVTLVVGFSSPAGLWMATEARGGLPAEFAFATQAILWLGTTLLAWFYARRKKWQLHLRYMTYSYALALGAVSLRIYTYLLPCVSTAHPIEIYITAAWLSWVGNICLAKLWLKAGWEAYLFRHFFNKKTQ